MSNTHKSSLISKKSGPGGPVKLGSIFQKHRQKLVVFGLWIVIVAAYWLFTQQTNLSPVETARYLAAFLQNSAYGPLVFLAIYLVRPVVLFPTSIMTLMAGFLFGPVWGVIYATGGNIITAGVAFVIGSYFGQDIMESEKGERLVDQYADYLRRNNFEAVLVMRLILLNYDLVSYLAGFLRVDWKAFLWATVLGSVAGTTAYSLAGSAIEGDFSGEIPTVDPWMLGVAALLFGISLVCAWYFRYRTHRNFKNQPSSERV